MIDINGTTWAHANVIIGDQLRRIVVATDGPGKGAAASFPTLVHTPGECAHWDIRHFTANTWEDAVTTAEALA